MRLILLIFFLINCLFSFAQLSGIAGYLQDPSAGGYFLDGTDPFVTGNNAAGNARMARPMLGLSVEKRYGLRSLNQGSFSLAIPSSSGCWSLQLGYFGFNKYAETRAGLCYGRPLGSRLDLGLRFNYMQLRIPGFQGRSVIYPQIGFRYMLNENLMIGWSVSNPGGKIKLRGLYPIPIVYRIGIGYKISELTGIAAEILKEEGRVPAVVAAVRYRPLKHIELRGGIYSNSKQFFFNTSVQKNKMRYTIGLLWHQELGFSPTMVWHSIF